MRITHVVNQISDAARQFLDIEAGVDFSESEYEDDDREDDRRSSFFAILASASSDLCFNDSAYFIDDEDVDEPDPHATQTTLTWSQWDDGQTNDLFESILARAQNYRKHRPRIPLDETNGVGEIFRLPTTQDWPLWRIPCRVCLLTLYFDCQG